MEVRYFSSESCSVCRSLKPKLRSAISALEPHVKWVEYNIKETPEVAAASGVFVVPVVIIFAEGKEYKRFIRSFSVSEVNAYLNRLLSIRHS